MADLPHGFSAQQEYANEQTPLLATEYSELNHDTVPDDEPDVTISCTRQNMAASTTTTCSPGSRSGTVDRTQRGCMGFIKRALQWIMAPEPREEFSYPDTTFHWLAMVEVLGRPFPVVPLVASMVASIDTATDCNLISRETFNKYFDNDSNNDLDNDLESLDFEGSPLELVTCQGQQVKLMGRKKVRVWFPAYTRDGKTSTRQKFLELTFFVMEEESDAVNFNILIGAATILKHRLLVPGPLTIGPRPIRTKKPAVDQENIDAEQAAADERRRQEEVERQAAQRES